MNNMYLSATFKQAVADGIVRRGEFAYAGSGMSGIAEGWLTEQYAVADETLFVQQHETRSLRLGYTITHQKTGFALFSFEAYHVALNFMLEVERVFLPFESHEDDYFIDVCVPYMKKRGFHACQVSLPKQTRKAA